MAFTLIMLNDTRGGGHPDGTTALISQDYAPHKERDASGEILLDSEWQHPEPQDLYYCKLGKLMCDSLVAGILNAMLSLGARQMGGDIRVLSLDECDWLENQIESWEDRHAREHEEDAERERQYWAEMEAEELARTPVYDFCERCGQVTEACKGPSHRGWNQCMDCGGGVGDPDFRHCINCCDLPNREKREALLGHPIVYGAEEPPPHLQAD